LGIVFSDGRGAHEASGAATAGKFQERLPNNAKNAGAKVAHGTGVSVSGTQARLIKAADRVTLACAVVGIKAQC
jgi:hypothetical protein